MRVARYHEFGPPGVIAVEEMDPLSPRTDEVRISVEAVGVNPCDALRWEGLSTRTRIIQHAFLRSGSETVSACRTGEEIVARFVSEWIWDDDLPLIPGSDVAGVVESTGTDGSEFSVGDRVFGTVPMTNVTGSRGDRQGVAAERATVRTDRLAPLPDEVPFVQGATAGVIAGTAWRALRELADLPPGGSALIHGGSGGVGHVAVQLASAMGADVFATAHPDNDRDLL